MALADGLRESLKARREQGNPCRRLEFADDANEIHGTNCNSPRCPDCGPLKFDRLWNGVQETFGSQGIVTSTYDDEEYNRISARIRQARVRHGVDYQFVSWHIGGDTRVIFTDYDLEEGGQVMTASIKASLKNAYLTGLAALRKSWSIASVTLLRISITESVTGRLRYWRRRTHREKMQQFDIDAARERTRNAGIDPDEWKVWDEDDQRASTITAGKRAAD